MTATTTIVGTPPPERAVGTFADIAGAEPIDVRWTQEGLRVTFAGVLDADTAARVYDRIVSADDATEQLRSRLRTYRAALAVGDQSVIPAALGDLIMIALGSIDVTTAAVVETAEAIASGAITVDEAAPADGAGTIPTPEVTA